MKYQALLISLIITTSLFATEDLGISQIYEENRKVSQLIEKEFVDTDIMDYNNCVQATKKNFSPSKNNHVVKIHHYQGNINSNLYRCLAESRINVIDLSKIINRYAEHEKYLIYKIRDVLNFKLSTLVVDRNLRLQNCNKDVKSFFPKYYFYMTEKAVEEETIKAICFKYKDVVEYINSKK